MVFVGGGHSKRPPPLRRDMWACSDAFCSLGGRKFTPNVSMQYHHQDVTCEHAANSTPFVCPLGHPARRPLGNNWAAWTDNRARNGCASPPPAQTLNVS